MGIDPGTHGAIAMMQSGGLIIDVIDTPFVDVKIGKTTRRRLSEAAVAAAIRGMAPDLAVVEWVQGRKVDSAFAAGELCRAHGIVTGVLAGLGVAVTTVQPEAWRRHAGVSLAPLAGDYKARKEASRQRALALWPGWAERFARKKDSDRAEACLIARWGCAATAAGGMFAEDRAQ